MGRENVSEQQRVEGEGERNGVKGRERVIRETLRDAEGGRSRFGTARVVGNIGRGESENPSASMRTTTTLLLKLPYV